MSEKGNLFTSHKAGMTKTSVKYNKEIFVGHQVGFGIESKGDKFGKPAINYSITN
jgi:hypothetical protein